MRADEKRPYYKLPQPSQQPKASILECVLALIGALVMATFFLAAVAAVGQ